MAFANTYIHKRVLITGHTGFKGSWLAHWLLELGAQVTGYALQPVNPALFNQIGLEGRIENIIGDVRDFNKLRSVISDVQPDFIFHLAAQPLVRLSYDQPIETYSTNIMGTVNLLEAIRLEGRPCAVVMITTDKCYENKEWLYGYREEDPMGGYDPYSSSKGAAELIISAYRRSYFTDPSLSIRVASARAGNVIGGGDWSLDRIVPDCIRSLQENEFILVRNKFSTRPWQHVLEPISGYLWLGACLYKPQLAYRSDKLDSAFNFGPDISSNKTVLELVNEILKHWEGRGWLDKSDPNMLHEASLLNLSTDKAYQVLGWKANWDFEQTVYNTINWYQSTTHKGLVTNNQITTYIQDALRKSLIWVQ
jgi:CDP-glucose 4,6-dehydratase